MLGLRTAWFLLAAAGAWAQIPQARWQALIEGGDAAALIAELQAQEPDYRVDAAMAQALCGRPELMQALLDYLYDGNEPSSALSTAAAEAEPGEAPSAAKPKPRADAPVPAAMDGVALFTQKIYELVNSLKAAAAIENQATAAQKQVETRAFISQLIASAENRATLDDFRDRFGGIDFLPDWVRDMIQRAALARSQGRPSAVFELSQNLTYSLPSREDGVRGYFSLFLVKHSPQEFGPEFNLAEALLWSHDAFPMTYDAKSDDFELTRLEQSSRNLLNVKKALEDAGELALFPGVWGVRFQRFSGKGRQYSDHSHYFEVEAGKAYAIDAALKRVGGGLKDLVFTVREK